MPNRILFLGTVLFLTVAALVGCSDKAPAPAAVAEQFLVAVFKESDAAQARALAAPEFVMGHEVTLDELLADIEGEANSEIGQLIQEKTGIVVKETTVNGDLATVSTAITMPNTVAFWLEHQIDGLLSDTTENQADAATRREQQLLEFLKQTDTPEIALDMVVKLSRIQGTWKVTALEPAEE